MDNDTHGWPSLRIALLGALPFSVELLSWPPIDGLFQWLDRVA